MEKNKVTKKEYFEMIKEYVKERPDLVEFCNHEQELLTRKNSGNSSKKATEENLALSKMLLDELSKVNEALTITALMNKSQVIKDYVLSNGKPLSNQKINAILQDLIKQNKVVNVKDKKNSYFSLAKNQEEE